MTLRYTGGIAAAGLASSVASSGDFMTGFVVLAAAAGASIVTAGALAGARGAAVGEALR